MGREAKYKRQQTYVTAQLCLWMNAFVTESQLPVVRATGDKRPQEQVKRVSILKATRSVRYTCTTIIGAGTPISRKIACIPCSAACDAVYRTAPSQYADDTPRKIDPRNSLYRGRVQALL